MDEGNGERTGQRGSQETDLVKRGVRVGLSRPAPPSRGNGGVSIKQRKKRAKRGGPSGREREDQSSSEKPGKQAGEKRVRGRLHQVLLMT